MCLKLALTIVLKSQPFWWNVWKGIFGHVFAWVAILIHVFAMAIILIPRVCNGGHFYPKCFQWRPFWYHVFAMAAILIPRVCNGDHFDLTCFQWRPFWSHVFAIAAIFMSRVWFCFREADHLAQLVAAMEAQPGQAEAAKVQIADLKQELAASQVNLNRSWKSHRFLNMVAGSLTASYG